MVKVIIADPIHESASIMLRNAGIEVIDLTDTKENIVDKINDVEGIIVRSATKVNKDLISNAHNLKIVGRAGVGLDNVDLEECKRKNIKVVNSPEGPTNSVAELALGLIIALSRKLVILDQGTKAGEWPKKIRGAELTGKTLGIIGSGAIGGKLAKYCISMGMNVLAYDIIKLPELESLDDFTYVELDAVLQKSDIISIHVPLVSATKHMLNDEAFQKMKDGVLIVNTARGGIIDENALYSALVDKRVGGVALDVFENEPVSKDFDLFKMPNVIATPHIGAQTHEANIKNATIVCEKLIDYLIS